MTLSSGSHGLEKRFVCILVDAPRRASARNFTSIVDRNRQTKKALCRSFARIPVPAADEDVLSTDVGDPGGFLMRHRCR